MNECQKGSPSYIPQLSHVSEERQNVAWAFLTPAVLGGTGRNRYPRTLAVSVPRVSPGPWRPDCPTWAHPDLSPPGCEDPPASEAAARQWITRIVFLSCSLVHCIYVSTYGSFKNTEPWFLPLVCFFLNSQSRFLIPSEQEVSIKSGLPKRAAWSGCSRSRCLALTKRGNS